MIVPSNCLVGTGRFMARRRLNARTRTRLSTAVSPAFVSSSGVAVTAVASELESACHSGIGPGCRRTELLELDVSDAGLEAYGALTNRR